jgi:hypothetical protein
MSGFVVSAALLAAMALEVASAVLGVMVEVWLVKNSCDLYIRLGFNFRDSVGVRIVYILAGAERSYIGCIRSCS